jgi:hypothetical protein
LEKYAKKACFVRFFSILQKKCMIFVVSKPVQPEVGIPPTSSVFLKKMQTKSFIEDFLRHPHPARPHMDTPCTSTHGYTLHVHTWIHPARPHMDTSCTSTHGYTLHVHTWIHRTHPHTADVVVGYTLHVHAAEDVERYTPTHPALLYTASSDIGSR